MAEKKQLIRTPERHIPIGEPVKYAGGQYGLRIKRPNSADMEEIPMDLLYSMVIKAAERKV